MQQHFQFNFRQVQQLQQRTGIPVSLIVSGEGGLQPAGMHLLGPVTPVSYACNHVWMQPAADQVDTVLYHYFQCKNTAPSSTSAVILLPKHLTHSFKSQFKHMQLLREYPPGTCVVTNSQGRFTAHLRGTLCAWFDAPLRVQTGQFCDELVVTGTHNCLEFTGAIPGSKSRLKVDTGASHDLLSSTFVAKTGLFAVTPWQMVRKCKSWARALRVCDSARSTISCTFTF